MISNLKHKFDSSIIRSYDIRGIYGRTLLKKDARVIGNLFGLTVGKNNTINVGYDGRHSSNDLKESLICGILESGANVCEIGLVPTPLLYFSCINNNSAGGIMVTGSHNPKDYNGFKFVLDNAPFYGEDLKLMENKAQDYFLDDVNAERKKIDFHDEYIKNIFKNYSQEKKINIVWDSGNGSAGKVMKDLSRKIEGNQKLLFCEIDGDFPNHHPDPSDPKNLIFCKNEILKNEFDLGIAFDGDGDRIGVVDDKGRIVPGDILLLILAKSLIQKNKNATIIGDVKCSQILFDEVEKAGANSIISQTGHSHVKVNMKKYSADLAGEMSGHIFFKENYGFDDALFASVELIKILTSTSKKLSQIIDEIPNAYNTPEIRIDCDDDKKFKLIKKISDSQKKKQKKIIDIDGLRVVSKDGWWLLRASNTQPSIVLRCESKSYNGLCRQLEEVKSVINEFDSEIAKKILVEK